MSRAAKLVQTVRPILALGRLHRAPHAHSERAPHTHSEVLLAHVDEVCARLEPRHTPWRGEPLQPN